LNRQFSKEVQIANEDMRKCSMSSTVKEMQIKTSLRLHLTPVSMAVIKKTNNNAGEDKRVRKTALQCRGGNVN
jgi:hypothetical protein